MIGDLRHARRRLTALSYQNQTRPAGREITFTGQSSHLAHHKGHEVTQRPEFQRAFVVFSVRFVLEPRPEQELADRLVILPVRMLTCAVLRLTKRTNHLRGSHS